MRHSFNRTKQRERPNSSCIIQHAGRGRGIHLGCKMDKSWEKEKEEEDKVRNNKAHILPFTKLWHRKFALLRSGKKVYKFNCSLSNDELLMRQSQNWVFLVIKMLRKHCFMKCQCVSKKSLWLWNETLENEFVLGC